MVVGLKYDIFPNLILVMACYFILFNIQTLIPIPNFTPSVFKQKKQGKKNFDCTIK